MRKHLFVKKLIFNFGYSLQQNKFETCESSKKLQEQITFVLDLNKNTYFVIKIIWFIYCSKLY